MTKNIYIKKSLAAFLLLIFAVATTPKKFLHDAFANHKDYLSPYSNGKFPGKKIAASAFHCQCVDLVVEAPFISDKVSIQICAPDYFQINLSERTTIFVTSLHISFGLRGPPAVV